MASLHPHSRHLTTPKNPSTTNPLDRPTHTTPALTRPAAHLPAAEDTRAGGAAERREGLLLQATHEGAARHVCGNRVGVDGFTVRLRGVGVASRVDGVDRSMADSVVASWANPVMHQARHAGALTCCLRRLLPTRPTPTPPPQFPPTTIDRSIRLVGRDSVRGGWVEARAPTNGKASAGNDPRCVFAPTPPSRLGHFAWLEEEGLGKKGGGPSPRPLRRRSKGRKNTRASTCMRRAHTAHVDHTCGAAAWIGFDFDSIRARRWRRRREGSDSHKAEGSIESV